MCSHLPILLSCTGLEDLYEMLSYTCVILSPLMVHISTYPHVWLYGASIIRLHRQTNDNSPALPINYSIIITPCASNLCPQNNVDCILP